jgi:glycosyltransferase involved in cell wall biosynthesis
MNILIALNSNISYTKGGIERTTLNLFNYLNNQEGIKAYGLFNGFPSDLIFKENLIKGEINDPLKLKEIIIAKRINIILFPGGPWYTKIGSEAVKGTNCKIVTAYHSKYDSKDIIFKRKLISELKYKPNFKIKVKAFIKLVFYSYYFKKNYNYWQNLMKIGYAQSDAFLLLSEGFIKPFTNYFNLKESHKLHGIGNALSFDEFYPTASLNKKKNKILIVGRLSEASKRISISIKAWSYLEKQYPDWELIIVGEGRDEKLYKDLKLKYNLTNLKFDGRQNPVFYYKESKIFISTSSTEGWGMAITEAMQFGCVPICVDSYESLHDIVQNEINGIIIKNDDQIVFNLKDKIELLINSELYRNKLAAQAIEDSKKFTMDKIGAKWLQLFKNLIQ